MPKSSPAQLRRNKKYRELHADKLPAQRRFNEYRLTEAQFGVMLGKQEGLCAVCTEPLGRGHKTHVDHDHATGKTRGLLCHRCNRGIGQFRDNAGLLTTAAAYLTFHGRVS